MKSWSSSPRARAAGILLGAALAALGGCAGPSGTPSSAAAQDVGSDSAAVADATADTGAAEDLAALDSGSTDSSNAADTAVADTAAPEDPWSKVFTGADGQKYTVGLQLPTPIKLGKNTATLFVQRTSDGSTWTPVTDATIKLTTLMVSMGHGSAGNVSPVTQGDGSYVGTVAFSMPGDWRITFAVTVGGKLQGSVHYDLKI